MCLRMVRYYRLELQMWSKNKEKLSLSIKKGSKFRIDLMKVILLENIQKLGSIGEIIDVKRGYARNF